LANLGRFPAHVDCGFQLPAFLCQLPGYTRLSVGQPAVVCDCRGTRRSWFEASIWRCWINRHEREAIYALEDCGVQPGVAKRRDHWSFPVLSFHYVEVATALYRRTPGRAKGTRIYAQRSHWQVGVTGRP